MEALQYLLHHLAVAVLLVLCQCGRTSQGTRRYEEACYSRCKCLSKGSILTCRQSVLTSVPPLLSTTMVVDLDDNRIRVLRNNSFTSAVRIEIVSLESNGIVHIESGAFEVLSDLQILRLGRNRLSYLSRNIFWNNRDLEVLDLHGNLFTAIPDNIMYHLSSLKLLNISYNLLKSPNLGPGFKYTPQLSSLDLTGNNFVSLEPHVFQSTHWWDEQITHYLNLSYCNIRHVHENALSQLQRLEYLSLEGNYDITQADLRTALRNLQVSSLQSLNLSKMNITNVYRFFHQFQHEQLQSLDLSCNNIAEIAPRTFYYLENLRSLDLRHNKLTGVGDLNGLAKLEALYLGHNRIHNIAFTAFEGLQTLRVLDISHNLLTVVDERLFEKSFDLHSLDISHNRISDLAISSGLENLQVLRLGSNLIRNIDLVRRLLQLQELDAGDNKIESIDLPLFTETHSFVRVNLSHNDIIEISLDAFFGSSHEVVDLSYNHLARLDQLGWRRVQKLFLQGNAIDSVSPRALHGLTMLTDLHLEDNNLQRLPHSVFRDTPNLRHLAVGYNPLGRFLQRPITSAILGDLPRLETLSLSHVGMELLPSFLFTNQTQLRTLDLSGNRISELRPTTFFHMNRLVFLNISANMLTEPDPVTFISLPRLRTLDASYNAYQCTCELMQFRNWLSLTNVTLPDMRNRTSRKYLCAGPPEWQGIALVDFHLESNTCSHHENAVIFASVGCTVLALILLMLFGVYRYKWWVRRKLRRTQYSVIDDVSTVQINPRHSREWV